MKNEINIAPNTDVLSSIELGNGPSVAGASLFCDMKMIEDLGLIYATSKSKKRSRYAIYECPYCGKFFRAKIYHVKTERIKSCGCITGKLKGDGHKTHGLGNTRIYNIWSHMIERCHSAKDKRYYDYGGRGISVCDEWRYSVVKFNEWAINNGYTEELTLDRIDNDGNYCPENCRWITRSQNSQNHRGKSKRNDGYHGIYEYAKNRFESRIWINNKRIYLGSFDTAKEAAAAYNNYVIENKTFHPLNKILND